MIFIKHLFNNHIIFSNLNKNVCKKGIFVLASLQLLGSSCKYKIIIYIILFLVTNKLSGAMCNVIKGLLDDEIVNPNIIIEKCPMRQLIDVSSPVSTTLISYLISY